MPPPPAAVEVEGVTDTSGVTIPDPLAAPLAVNELHGRRRAHQKSQWGVAAPSMTESFKLRDHSHKPKAKSWDHRISTEAKRRQAASLKGAAKYLGKPGLISLGGGLPSSEYFPFDALSVKVPHPPNFGEADVHALGAVLTAGKHDLATGSSLFDIATAFNYGQTNGSAQLLRWMVEHTELVHDPPYADWACVMTVGSTSALDMALRMFAEPGDAILTEEYTFATAVETARPMGLSVVGIDMDDEGLLPDSLDAVLSAWDPAARGGARKPFVVYTVPTGQNPTGATQGAARRAHLYAVAQKHDLFLLEDEPYYFLQMQPYAAGAAPAPPPRSHADFLARLVPSLLSLDTDGRVLRMDSFSKVVAPGSRCGWVTCAAALAARYQMHADVSTQGSNGFAQLALFKLLDEHWGHAGYLDWLVHIRLEYTRRRDVMLRACEEFLPREVVSWKPPMAGMFHWLRIDHTRHPSRPALPIPAIEESLFLAAVEHGCLVMRGSWFHADKGAAHDTLFFRATYAAAGEEKIREGIRRFGEAVRAEFGLPPREEANGKAEGNGE